MAAEDVASSPDEPLLSSIGAWESGEAARGRPDRILNDRISRRQKTKKPCSNCSNALANFALGSQGSDWRPTGPFSSLLPARNAGVAGYSERVSRQELPNASGANLDLAGLVFTVRFPFALDCGNAMLPLL